MSEWVSHSGDGLVDGDSYAIVYEPYSCIISTRIPYHQTWEDAYAWLTSQDRGWKSGAEFELLGIGNTSITVLYRRVDTDWSNEFCNFVHDVSDTSPEHISAVRNIMLPECTNAARLFGDQTGDYNGVIAPFTISGTNYMNFKNASSMTHAFAGLTFTSSDLNIVWPDAWVNDLSTRLNPNFRGVFKTSELLPNYRRFNVTAGNRNLSGLFEEVSNLRIDTLDLSGCEDADYMFSHLNADYHDVYIGQIVNTGNLKSAYGMFDRSNITTIPSFGDLSSLETCTYMFNGCFYVTGGILDMYNKLKDIPGLSHLETFRNCGAATETGAAELAQIPSDWK